MTDDDSKPLRSPGTAFAERWKKRAKFAAGRKGELRFREAALGAKSAGKHPRTRSEKSRSSWRVDPIRDEKIYRLINACLRKGQPVRVSVRASYVVSAARKSLADSERYGPRIIPTVFLPHWDHADRLLKMVGWGMASHDLGAVPFTLRLSTEVIEKARAAEVGIGRHLQDRITRHLRHRLSEGVPAFWFAVEQGVWDEPHLHGAIVIPEGRQDEVKAALIAAGGAWVSRARQLGFSRRKNLVVWVGYATKWLFGSKVKLRDENLTGANHEMRRNAKRCYNDARSSGSVLYP